MTPSYSTFLAIDDFISIRLRCRKCHASLHIPLEEKEEIPRKCPVCEREWFVIPSPYLGSTKDFAKYLVELRQSVLAEKKQPNNSNCEIHLEIQQTPPSESP